MKPSDELRVLSPTAILGYGFPVSSFEAGLAEQPDVIAVDAGSTDPGPYYLGAGVSFTDRNACKRDLEFMMQAAAQRNIPVIVGSSGGSGALPHLTWTQEIVEEIAREQCLVFKLATIASDISPQMVSSKLKDGKIKPLHPVAQLTQEDIDASTYIVAQIGVEPIVEALKQGAQIILAGRAYDPTVFSALASVRGMNMGLATHMGKILECASIACVPGSGSDCMMGYLNADSFRVKPLNPQRACTRLSVAAHTLYEKSNPYYLKGPGGVLDLTKTQFVEIEDGAVRVSGSVFIPDAVYTVKLEASKRIGYRTVAIAGVRDPIMIDQLANIQQAVRERVQDNFSKQGYKYFLDIKIYGKNAVMGDLEPLQNVTPHECGIVIEAIADTQEIASTICSFARSTMLHYGYPGRVATAGNLAFPYSPSDFKAGEVYQFSMYHVMEIDDPVAEFPAVIKMIGGNA